MDEEESTKILIEVTSLFDQYGRRGIGRYTRDILKRFLDNLVDKSKCEINLVGFNDLEQNLMEIGLSTFFIEEHSSKFKFHSLGKPNNSSVRNILRWKQIEDVIYEVEPDIYWAMHFERGLPTVPNLKTRFKPKHTVVTVHDVIPLVNNKFSRKNPIINFLKGKFYRFMWEGVKHADLILTCSEFSKGDLLKFGEVSENQIFVTHLGINPEFYKEKVLEIPENERAEIIERFEVKGEKYFFYDSGLESNKGIDNLIEILTILKEKNIEEVPDKILITGGDFYKGKGENIKPRSELGRVYMKKFKEKGLLDRVVATSKVTEEELQVLLGASTTYIYLSEYEGFGFGPIQAMAAEVPTIVNNSSCLPEITSGASLMVDATDHSETVNKIIDLMQSEKQQKELIQKGKEVCKKYDWEITSEKTYEAIKGLLEAEGKGEE